MHKLTFLSIVLVAGLLLSYRYIKTESNDMVLVKGGNLVTTDPVTNKSIEVKIKSFLLDKNLVTVADFDAFIKATIMLRKLRNLEMQVYLILRHMNGYW